MDSTTKAQHAGSIAEDERLLAEDDGKNSFTINQRPHGPESQWEPLRFAEDLEDNLIYNYTYCSCILGVH